MVIIFVILSLIIFITWYIDSRIFLALYQWLIFFCKHNPPVIKNASEFLPGHETIEDNWKKIHDEVVEVLNRDKVIPRFHEVDGTNTRISFSSGPAWRTLIIKAFGGWFENNSELLPYSSGLIKKFPGVSSALISILEPGARIPAHTGKLKGILRYHLGLIVPKGAGCYMIVGGEKLLWKEGEAILFDDTFEHEVVNETSGYRVILFLNVERSRHGFKLWINNLLLKIIVHSPVFTRARLKSGLI